MGDKFLQVEELKKARDVAGLRAKLVSPDVQASKSLRGAIASALASIGSRHALDTMLALACDPAENVRHKAINALGELGDAAAVGVLSERLSSDETGLRCLAAKALGAIGGHEAVDALVHHGMHDDEVGVRLASAASLGHLQAREALEVLCGALRDPSRLVRVDAAVALVRIRDDRAVESLQRYWEGAT